MRREAGMSREAGMRREDDMREGAGSIEPQPNREELAAKYTRPRSVAVRAMVRAALGTELANGYTTVEQADELLSLLGLAPRDRLLDLGAGRGWPGGHLASASGCSVASTDLTFEAASLAHRHHVGAGLEDRATALAANGTALPFRDAAFDAVVHADVLC